MDSVARMLAFKERHADAEIKLTPSMVTARIPCAPELFWSMSLNGLMDQLEKWEQQQQVTRDWLLTGRIGPMDLDVPRMLEILLSLGHGHHGTL
jgi:hypothetical protein